MSKKKERKSLPIEKRKELNMKMFEEFEQRVAEDVLNNVKSRIIFHRTELAKKYLHSSERAVETTIRRIKDQKEKEKEVLC